MPAIHPAKSKLFNLLRGLREGDPVVWAIVAGVVVLLAFLAYLKSRINKNNHAFGLAIAQRIKELGGEAEVQGQSLHVAGQETIDLALLKAGRGKTYTFTPEDVEVCATRLAKE